MKTPCRDARVIDLEQRRPTRGSIFWAQLDALARQHRIAVHNESHDGWWFEDFADQPGCDELPMNFT